MISITIIIVTLLILVVVKIILVIMLINYSGHYVICTSIHPQAQGQRRP